MITQIHLQNVRIFDENPYFFDLPAISVFCGTNSSGKSTILMSLLLLRQTKGITESFISSRGRLRFIGSQVDLGNYKSFVSHEDLSKNITIGITIKDSISQGAYRAIKSYAAGVEDEIDLGKRDAKRVQYFLKSTFNFSAVDSEPGNRRRQKGNRSDQQFQGVLNKAEFEMLDLNNERITNWIVTRKSVESKNYYAIQFPKKYFVTAYGALIPELIKDIPDLFPELHEEDQFTIDENKSNDEYVEFRTSLFGILPNKITIEKVENSSDAKSKSIHRFELPFHPILEAVQRDLQIALESIEYLGPLRTPAKRYYLTPLDTNPHMDPAGEFLPYVFKDLSQGKRYIINYMPPGEVEIKKNVSLVSAVNSWIHYIRTGSTEEIDSRHSEIEYEQTKVVLEFKIKGASGDEQYALADSGFGYSQILPILIRGLISGAGSTIIVEQPELHLNPALQIRLAEFLVSLTKAGKQVIVETHSEHIVNMIRVLVAEDQSGDLSKKSKIYYIDNLVGGPCIHELSIDPNGMIPKWPQSFFGEAANLTGRLLRAQKRLKTPHKAD